MQQLIWSMLKTQSLHNRCPNTHHHQTNWGGPFTRKLICLPNRSLKKIKIRMGNTQFADDMQPLYFPDGHPSTEVFQGMKTIFGRVWLQRCWPKTYTMQRFKCPPCAHDCCCHCILHCKPYFKHVETVLETTWKGHSFQVNFLPKFHCKLSFIKQWWGYAKQLYHLNLESSHKDILKKIALAALNSVPLESMQQ